MDRSDTELFVPKSHVLRRVRAGVDFSFIPALIPEPAAPAAGRPAVPPEVIFRMMALARFYGIRSERRLCEEVQVNIAFRWFAGIGLSSTVPDHSTISRLRRRIGRERFAEIVARIQEQIDALAMTP